MILGRYIASHLARGWLLVFAILGALFALLSLIDEIDSLSERYRFVHALGYVLLTTPQRIVDLSPVIVALGTLFAFATLSRHSELVVMRAAGLSMRRLIALCALPTAVLVVGIGAASEFAVASLHHRAETQRMVLRSGNLDLLESRGLWSRGEQRVLNVQELRMGQLPEGIRIYELAPDGSLERAIEAARAEPLPDRRWRLRDVRVKEWRDGRIDTAAPESLDIGPFWSATELPALGQSLAAMPPSALWSYAEHLRATGQDDTRVRMAFWQKLALPWSAGAMVLLCAVIGIGFGSTRSAAFGVRVLAGAAIGTGFYLLTQIMHTGGQLLGLDQPAVVTLPILLVLLVAFAIAARTRRPR
jgi:lipopolysaccharide export system permease protein